MLSSDFLFPHFLVFPPANPSTFSHYNYNTITIIVYTRFYTEVRKNAGTSTVEDAKRWCQSIEREA